MQWFRALCLSLCILLTTSLDVLAQGQPEQTNEPLPPVHLLPEGSDSDFWRSIRQGDPGLVSIPDATAGLMIQSEGDNWRSLRNGLYQEWSAYLIVGMIVLLAAFYVLRGRIKISKGWSDETIIRFRGIERFAHWLTAVSFIILAITGLNLMFGRALIPILAEFMGSEAGKGLYAQVTMYGKLAHNSVGFAFMVGIVLMFVLWVWHNIPNHHDLIWFAKGGGILSNEHPPAKKFNGGQKIIFWLTVLGGGSLAVSGIALIYPFQFELFNGTFAVMNKWLGTSLPTDLGPIQEMQLATLWHGVVAVVMTVVIIAHIYIGSVGMQGAFAAMGSGKVDRNWARDHHSLWVEDVEARRAVKTPAE